MKGLIGKTYILPAIHPALLAFSLGVVSLRCIDTVIPGWIFAVGFTALCAILYCCRKRVVWLSIAFLSGLAWANCTATQLVNQSIPVEYEMQDLQVIGQVVSIPVNNALGQRFEFHIEEIWSGDETLITPGIVRLRIYDHHFQVKYGERWEMTVRIKNARGFQNPGKQFDYETWLFANRIRATGYVRNPVNSVVLAEEGGMTFSLNSFRSEAAKFIESRLGQNKESAIITALTLGLKSSMDQDQWEILQRTGTIHLVAISGLHIGLVSAWVFFLTSLIWKCVNRGLLWMPAIRFGLVCGMVSGIIYAMLAGMTIPTQRAVLMLGVVAASMLLNRKSHVVDVLIAVAFIVLLFDPLAVLVNGFWLSFSAVIILVMMAKDRGQSTKKIPILHAVIQSVVGWGRIQIILTLCMFPLLLVLFNQIPLFSPIANAIAVPVIGMIVVPCSLIGLFCYSVGLLTISEGCLKLAALIVEWAWYFLDWISGFSFSVWYHPSPPVWLTPIIVVGVLIILLPKAFPSRWLALIWLAPVVVMRGPSLQPGEFRYTILDIGHGLASVVETQNHVLVYDTGPFVAGGIDSGDAIVAPFLRHRGIDSIDMLIVSHGDNDHIGGHKSVVRHFDPRVRLTSVPEEIEGGDFCQLGQAWKWDAVRFEILWPRNRQVQNGNNASCVLKISTTGGSLLITGDIEKESEAGLIEDHGHLLKSDILQIPHQGSRTSSTNELLDHVMPEVALVSTGYLNRYGHPHPDVIERYWQRNIQLFDTATDGAITVNVSDDEIAIVPYRQINTGFWKIKSTNQSIKM